MHVLIAPDKFKGTLSALEVASAMARAAQALGITAVQLPLADGGEGIVHVLGGENCESTVTGPLGGTVVAGWRLAQGKAVIELAAASGLTLVGGAIKNNPMKASSIGTGELIANAICAGASRIVVGAGGSACTDGGLGAVEILKEFAPLDGRNGVELLVACDVQTPFLQAATVFGAQKGATPSQIEMLTTRLEELSHHYKEEFGVDVTAIPGSGAAGGFAGGMAALGATIIHGFDLIAQEVDLETYLARCDLVLTGEGLFDQTSFEGKVVGSLMARAKQFGVPCAVIAGRVAENVKGDFEALSLVDLFGVSAAMNEPASSVEYATRELLQRILSRQEKIDRGE